MKLTCVGFIVVMQCFGGDDKAPDTNSFCEFAKPIYYEFQKIPKDEARAIAPNRRRAILKTVADYKSFCLNPQPQRKQ